MSKRTTARLTKNLLFSAVIAAATTHAMAEVKVGSDLNSAQSANPDIAAIYSANRGDNGGDQSLQFGDVIQGTELNDVLIGGLGIDVLLGGYGDDILIGGTEDFNPLNRDRAFGQEGDDVFLWAPGDGNDFFDGGAGTDVLFMTLIGESRSASGETQGAPFFAVSPPNTEGSQDFDGIYLDEYDRPILSIDNGPGFCEVIERDSTNTDGLNELGLDHLVRFILRGPRQAFELGGSDPAADDGLRVAIHLNNVEFLVCAGETAGTVKILDLSTVPAQEVDRSQLPVIAAELIANQLPR